MPDGNQKDKIIVNTTEHIYLIKKENIIRCEGNRNYTTIYPKEEKKILVAKTLKEFDNMLCFSGFIRVHQSHLVNTAYIKRVDKVNSRLVMEDKSMVPVSFRKRDFLMRYLKTMMTS